MSEICPTVLAANTDDYQEQVEVLESFAERIQIDLGDGVFTTASVLVGDIWWPDSMMPDIHLMHQRPLLVLEKLIQLNPRMIIFHAESEDVQACIDRVRQGSIKVGLALLPETEVEAQKNIISQVDHVLIFGGKLGSFGGHADLAQLGKVSQVRDIKPDMEIGWDGGANLDNVQHLAESGIDVINVGGAIQKANNPENAYRALVRQLQALSEE